MNDAVLKRLQDEINSLRKRVEILEEQRKVKKESDDNLLEDAARLVVQHDQVSASLIQRRLAIGYAHAARILDQLEEKGVIGPGIGSKPRDVLLKSYEEYQKVAKK